MARTWPALWLKLKPGEIDNPNVVKAIVTR